jgi:predicted nucleic acid-binding protein
MAIRRKRITPDQAKAFLEKLSSQGIRVEPPLSPDQIEAVFSLCLTHTLTFYDGTYLELASRMTLPLATLDQELVKAAPFKKVHLI